MCLARTPSPFDMFWQPGQQWLQCSSVLLFQQDMRVLSCKFCQSGSDFSSKGRTSCDNNLLGPSSQHLVINTAALLCFSCPDHFLFWMAASPKPVAPGKVGLGPWRRVEGRLCSVLSRIQLFLSQWLNSAHLSLSHSSYLQALQFCMNRKVCGPESLFQHLGKT